MTTTRVYQSTDVGAPVLTGQVGALTTLLSTVLVGGGGVAYGSGADQKLAAGWALAFSASSRIALRNSLAAGGTGHFVVVDDTGSTAAGAREAVVKCYVGMSDINTPIGADVMPDTTIFPGGGTVQKSETANGTARAWKIVADELTCWLWIEANTPYQRGLHGFGDFDSEVAGDSYRSVLVHQQAAWSSFTSASRICGGGDIAFASPTSSAQSRGVSVMRGYSGASAGSIQCGCPVYGKGAFNMIAGTSGGASAVIASAVTPGSNEQYFTPAMICAQGMLRGRLRGLYYALNDLRSVASGTIRNNAAGLPSGSSLMLLHTNAGGNGSDVSVGVVAVETALSW